MYLERHGYDPNSFIELVDGGKSAKNLDRPKMTFLIREIINDRVENVIFYNASRLSRDVSDSNEFIKLCRKHHVNILCVNDQIKYSTANERGLFNITAAVYQMEREVDAERVQAAMQHMTNTKKWVYGKPPIGFKKDDQQHLIINEDEAYWIRKIFSMIKNHFTPVQITNELNELQALGHVWKYNTVHKIINSKIYFGEFRDVSNFAPAIISQREFKEAQDAHPRKHNSKINHFKYLPKVQCACGRMAITDSAKKDTKKYLYYYCDQCNLRINENKIDNQILPYVDHLFEMTKSYNNDLLQKKLQKLLMKKEECYRKFLADKITLEIYQDLMSNICNDIQTTSKKIEQNQKKIVEKKINKRIINTIKTIKVDMVRKKIIDVELLKKE